MGLHIFSAFVYYLVVKQDKQIFRENSINTKRKTLEMILIHITNLKFDNSNHVNIVL